MSAQKGNLLNRIKSRRVYKCARVGEYVNACWGREIHTYMWIRVRDVSTHVRMYETVCEVTNIILF